MIRLRLATIDDVKTLQHWDTKAHVIAASGEDDQWDWPGELPRLFDWREYLIAEEDGRPIGMLQIIDPKHEETHYWGEIEDNLRAIDIWIGEETDLARGFGTEMMRLALARCFANEKVEAVLVDPLAANTRAHRFYERQGFKPVERRVFGEDDCLVMRVERPAWEEFNRQK